MITTTTIVLFILGLSALIAPLVVARELVRLHVPVMIGVSVLTLVLALDGVIGRLDGLLLFAGFVGYTVVMIRQSRRDALAGCGTGTGAEAGEAGGGSASLPPTQTRGASLAPNVGLIVLGLGLLVLGARWLVEASVAAATALEVSELVVGLTVVAAGTSLPEVATSVLATIRGERDIAVGNVVGSNIFNILAVLGLGGIVAPDGVGVSPGALTFDIPVMIAVALATLPILFTGHVIAAWEGAVFLGYYLAYTAYLVVDATQHHALDELRAAMVWFVLPLTVLTLLVVLFRSLRSPAARGPRG